MNEAAPEISGRATRISLAVLIAAHALLLGWASVRNSVTFDEYAHLPAGCAYWKWREFSVYNLSPPFLRALAAWPAVLSAAEIPDAAKFRKFAPKDRHWFYGEAFLRANFNDHYHRFFVLGRLAMIPLSCLGAWVIFAWARELFGNAAGLAAAAMYCSDPNVLASASLVGTDAGTAVFVTLALWLWDRFCRAPTPRRAMFAAVAISAALLCKFSALLIWPAIVGMSAVYLARNRRRWREVAAGFAIAVVASFFLINLSYGYQRSFEPLKKFSFVSPMMIRAQQIAPSLPAPFPRQFVLGFDTQKWESEGRYEGYLLGQRYVGTRWYFYPVVLFLKLPAATLALIVLACASAAFSRAARARLASANVQSVIVAIALVGAGMILLVGINIGVRYLLPLLPLIFIVVSHVLCVGQRIRRIAIALIVIGAVESLLSAPNFLSFTNVFASGPGRAYRLLNDSNFDWGQGLLDLRSWMRDQKIDRIGLAYFGRVDPGVYGIRYTPINEPLPPDVRYVGVSSYFLVGLSQRLPTPSGPTEPIRLPSYRALQEEQPVAVIDRTIFIFRREQLEAAPDAR